MTTATVGTGTITLGSAVSGFLSFAAAGVQNGDQVTYGISDGANSEEGTGTYLTAGTTLTRVVTTSTNSNNPINLSGSAQVFVNGSAQDLVPEAKFYQGRLTLLSNTPVLSSNQINKTQIFYTPYNGNLITIHNGTRYIVYPFSEVSLTLDTTNALSGNLYDVFMYNDAGTLRLGYGPPWTTGGGSNTARGTGAGSTAIGATQGLQVNSNTITLRYDSTHTTSVGAAQATYVGTFYATANGQTGMNFNPTAASGGTANILGLYNAYNKFRFAAYSRDSTSSWTYATATWRAANGSASNSISYVDGLADVTMDSSYVVAPLANASGSGLAVGINRDSTSATPDFAQLVARSGANSVQAPISVIAMFLPSLGFHTVNAVETSMDTNTQTFFGTGLGVPMGQSQYLTAIATM